MKTLRGARPSPAMVVAIVALVAGLGGGAYAATVAKNSVGAKQLKKNAVTSAKVKKGAVTNEKLSNEAVSLEKLGATARSAWARVNGSDGSVIEGSPGVTATRVGAGIYFVDLGFDLSAHPPLATIGEFNNGQIGLERCGPGGLSCTPPPPFSNSSDTVLVQTAAGDGSPANRSFYLAAMP